MLGFKGSMDAGEVASLREEVSAVLAVAQPGDEVLLRLESPDGGVHGYGLSALQHLAAALLLRHRLRAAADLVPALPRRS